jgi:hypothetical protein
MENRTILINTLKLIWGGVFLMTPLLVFAYEPETTHRALTQEMTKIFNQYDSRQISAGDGEHVIQGSWDEDAGVRPLHHFYDPIHDQGITLGKEWLHAKAWAQDTIAQATSRSVGINIAYGSIYDLFSSDYDFSWDRAVYEYAWGSKKRGLESLGHILHLIEDMAVPDHTRDDKHPPYADKFFHQTSPYEHWANKWDKETIGTASELQKEEKKPIICNPLSNCFDSIALYSNRNFFSKDTINSTKYSAPRHTDERAEILSSGVTYTFGYSRIDDSEYKLVRVNKNLRTRSTEYLIEDPDNLILSDYWSLLSKQAVLHGAGVVKLFFDEVEKEKQTKVLYNKNRSWISRQIDKFKSGTFGLASVLYGSSVALDDLEDKEEFSTSSNNNVGVAANTIVLADSSTSGVLPSTPDVFPSVVNSADTEPLPRVSTEVRPQPQPPPPSNTSAGMPIAGAAGPPPVELPSTPPPDTTAPNISFSITECNSSLSSDGCLIATTTVHLVWSSTASDLAYYRLECTLNGTACSGFNIATTTATTTTYNLPTDSSTYTFKAKARDTTGNESAFITKIVELALRPVVINEVAWAGTSATRDQDEWIELYNTTNKTISLSNWVLYSASDNSPYIPLANTIAGNSFITLERTDDTTLASTTAHQIYTGALVNTGEKLTLSYASTTIDNTPEVSTCSGWCGGQANSNYYTMERYDPSTSGENSSNWGTWAGFLNNGANADGVAIKGTPGKRNSINYQITKDGGPLNQDKTLTKTNSPYIVQSSTFAIGSEATTTLTIEPGVVIKFINDASLTVNSGKILAQGTAGDQIIFTSF